MILTLTALATPPDLLESQLMVLCANADSLSFQLQTSGNAGMHHQHTWELRAGNLHTPSRRFETVILSGLSDDVSQEPRRRTWTEPTPMNLPKWNPGFCPARPVREIRATLEGQTLILSLDDETRMVPLQVVDPRGNDWWNERPESWTGAVLDGSLSGMTLRALYPNAAHLIWKSEMETVGVFGVSPALPAAVSFLYNNRGLQHHRREEFPRAGMWFDRALDADPTNDTARFNLACSHARRSDVERTILALRGMPTTGLAKRVANDADFVGIRKDPALKAFLKDL